LVAQNDKLAKAALQLLGLFAYCASDDILLQLFIDGCECLPEPLKSALSPGKRPTHDKVLRHLTRYSLASLSRDEGGNSLLSMQRLLQEAVIDSMKPSVEAMAYDLSVVCEVFDYKYAMRIELNAFIRNAPHFAEIAQHAEVLLADIEQQEQVGWIYNTLGYGYDKLGDYDTALKWYKKSLAIRERVLGTEHPDTATS
jgi:tetratricopeptide (TPR) repeat protein